MQEYERRLENVLLEAAQGLFGIGSRIGEKSAGTDGSPPDSSGSPKAVSMQNVGSELARDSEVEIACQQASYTDHLRASLFTSEVGVD